MTREIILCATQRCGSTLFVEDMRNTGILGVPEEWFIPWNPSKEFNWKEQLESVRARATSSNGVFSVKVMANQVINIDACLSSFVKPPPGPLLFRFHKVFEKSVWVYLRRNDIVAQAVSRLMSLQTGINHATANEDDEHFAGKLVRGLKENYNESTRYSYERLMDEVRKIILENLVWQRFFDDFGISPIEFIYEEVIAKPHMPHLDIIAKAACIEEDPSKQPRRMVKMGNARNEEWIKRFYRDAVTSYFNLPSK